MSGYRVALPRPWQQIPLDETMGAAVDAIVDGAVQRIPADVPPDQVAQTRIKLANMLRKDMRRAKDNGGVDYHLPTDLMHGEQLNASEDAAPVDAGGTVWVRSSSVVETTPDDVVKDSVRARKVEYTTAVPGDQRRWIIVSFTTIGDGDPDSELTGLMVELFDAIMSTWRWQDGIS